MFARRALRVARQPLKTVSFLNANEYELTVTRSTSNTANMPQDHQVALVLTLFFTVALLPF
jgi:hypothetical protein